MDEKKIREQFSDDGAPLPDEALDVVAGGEATHLNWSDAYSKMPTLPKKPAGAPVPPPGVTAGFVPPKEKSAK